MAKTRRGRDDGRRDGRTFFDMFAIRHKNTGHYLKGPGEWTNQLDAALQFNSGLKLITYLERTGIRERPEALEVITLPREQ
jgi:hypothetical protein